MAYETVQFDLGDDHVATITLNRPHVLNSFNQAMLDEFDEIWGRCRTDDEVRVIVLRAAGERAFSTGLDRKEGRSRHPNPWSDEDPGLHLGAKQNRVWKPLICALHGMVAGGAFYWINEADVVICADDTEFFDPHTSYGMTAALEPIGLLRRIPFGEVMRMALFGLDERISATKALDIGLVTEVTTRPDLWPRAHKLATQLASKAPIAVQGTVKAVWESFEMSAAGTRTIPYAYPLIGNPMSEQDHRSRPSSSFERR
jgi:enoyl-CoA hydratase/carnithine racemase